MGRETGRRGTSHRYRSVVTTGSRPCFSVRAGPSAADEHDGPFEDVPAHLLVPLQRWVLDTLSYQGSPQDDQARPICLRLRILPLTDIWKRGAQYVKPLAQTAGTLLLDVADADCGFRRRAPCDRLAGRVRAEAGPGARVRKNSSWAVRQSAVSG